MSKITTDDCRDFLVSLAKNGTITGPWGPTHPKFDAAYVEAALTNPKNWKRFEKRRPDEEIYSLEIDGKWVDEPAANFAWQRRFDCVDPRGDFDGSVAYIVLERLDGTLVLGEDCGD